MRVKQMMVALAAMTMLSATAQADFKGTGTVSEVSGWFAAGSNVTVTATAGDNSEFSRWSGDTNDATVVNGEISFTVNEPMSITATFAHIFHDIEATAGSGGSIDPAGTISVPQGEDQEFTITPDENYHIADVLVDGSSVGTDSSYTFENVMDSHTIAASFALDSYTVTFDLAGGTLVSGETVQTVEHGSAAIAPDITPPEGYNFIGWDPAVFDSVTENMNIIAQYELKTYTLIYIAGANGSITGNTNQIVEHGSAGSAVTAVPDEGYRFVQWSDGIETAERQDTGVTGNIDVTANFALSQVLFTVTSEHGSPDPDGVTTNDWGTEITFSMPDSPVEIGGQTQYVATGWSVTEGSLAAGEGTNFTFTIEEDTAIQWQWSTNYWIEFTVEGE